MESRIIKFRGRSKSGFIYGYPYKTHAGQWWMITDDGKRLRLRGEPMQFTGLHDKNGVEIYEGDVVQIDGTTWVVSWNYGCFIVTVWNNSAAVATINQFRVPEQFEILGNVFSNPELVSE